MEFSRNWDQGSLSETPGLLPGLREVAVGRIRRGRWMVYRFIM